MKLNSTSVLVFSGMLLLLAAGPMQSVSAQGRQLSLADVLIALRSKKAEIAEKNKILTEAVKDRGITFTLTPEIEKELGTTGANKDLLDAIRQKMPVIIQTSAVMQKTEPTQSPVVVPKPTPTPLDFAFYRTRATTNLSSGNLDLAVSDLTKAIEFKHDDSGSYLDRGTAEAAQGRFDSAIGDFDQAVNLSPKNPVAFLSRGSAYEKIGKFEVALADYNKAAELDPANETARAAVSRIKDAQAKLMPKSAPETAKKPADVPEEPKTISVGALNTYATHLAMPTYSQINRRMGIQGKVTVQITLDESGKVVTAEASDGPKALRSVAEDAAKASAFKPATISDKPVKTTGFIIYNFVANQ